jgi:hypothetical protein
MTDYQVPDGAKGIGGIPLAVTTIIVATLFFVAGTLAYRSDLAVEYRINRAAKDHDTQALIAHSSRRNVKLSMLAVDHLARTGDPAALPVLETLTTHPDRSMRRKAIRSIVMLLATDSVPALLPCLRHSDRSTALLALECIGEVTGLRVNLEAPDAPLEGDLEKIQSWLRDRR